MYKVTEMYLTKNKYSRPGIIRERTTKIAIHYVGNPKSTALANRNYFENLKNGQGTYASSHYIVGLAGDIVACVPEEEIAYTTNSANAYSIGIECCHRDATGEFNSKTRQALIELVGDLLIKYNLTTEDIIRHYDVTGKACPLCWASNSGKQYEDYCLFKRQVADYLATKSTDKELAEAVSKIIKSGIALTFNKWKRKDLIKLEDVPALLTKLGGLDSLIARKVISSEDIWRKGSYTKDNVRSLLIKYSREIE